MKRSIQTLANWLGYRVIKVDSIVSGDAFADMKQLSVDIAAPIIFDVGAHHGQTAMAFRRVFPQSRILSFEPFPESFAILQHNTSRDQRITPFNFGLSDRVGIFSFHSNPSSATNSLLATDVLGAKTWGEGILETKVIVQAQFKTIDSVISELAIPKIDILKLDVQGAEPL